MGDESSRQLSPWALARSGKDGPLALGQSREEVVDAFGEPTGVARHISKYDSIELHFADNLLWLIHCEFGEATLPQGVNSPQLGIQPEGMEWPLDAASLTAMVTSNGFSFEIVQQPWGDEYRFGFAKVMLDVGDALVSWSILTPLEKLGSK